MGSQSKSAAKSCMCPSAVSLLCLNAGSSGMQWNEHDVHSGRVGCCRSESFLMMRTLRDMNMSKFVAEDVPLFISLIEDLFPSQKADRAQFPEVSAALEKVCSLCSQALHSHS